MAERTDRHGWIDLLVPDGPFLSAAALDVQTVGQNWPTRLSAEQRELLLALPASETEEGEGWDDSSWDGRRARVLALLTDLLGYREGKTLAVAPKITGHHHIYRAGVTADFAVHAPNEPDDVRMVVICGPHATDEPTRLDANRTHDHNGWVSTPVQRAALLARHADADLALVTNGREHLLVNVVTGTTGSAVWTVNGLEDRHARDAFVALLHKQRVLHRSVSLARLIELSQDRQHELTDTLGKQVRRAAEALVNSISRANRTSRRRLLDGQTGQQVYAATTRVLMRTVFLLVAEERGLLPVAENQLYADQYAMSTLLDKLEEDAYRNRSAMERRSGAWQRMMALSRAVHAGIEHDDLRLPAYGGNLFDPDEHPFLEARVPTPDGGLEQLDVGVVDDFTLLTMLRHLQIANGQRISFRSLDVEQIGHVYEALLDHSAVIVEEAQVAVLGLFGKAGDEPEVPLLELEAWSSKSDKELGKQLADRGVAAEAKGIYKAIDDGLSPDSEVAQTLNVAVANDAALRERVEPYAPLLRTDARGVALVFLPGDVYVTETSNKRDSGTAYTPRSLAEEIAKHTLDPLIYDPGPHNEPGESKWKLKSPEELLDLKVCDPAVGSGAILVAAVRYLAEALLQARVEAGELSAEALASGASDVESVDARVQARRAIVSRCIYGVDRDPMAVEMAKLSLWLITMARDEPFSFLDHAIRHGDSLLGITSLRQLQRLHLDPSRVSGVGLGQQLEFGGDDWPEQVEQALSASAEYRERLRSLPDTTVGHLAEKERLHEAAEAAGRLVRVVADAVVGVCLETSGEKVEATDRALSSLQPLVARLPDSVDELREAATRSLCPDGRLTGDPRECLHWPLDFADAFADGRRGFDAMLGNPPFLGGTKISEPMGEDFYKHIQRYVAGSKTNRADLCAFFFRRSAQVSNGTVGFMATNTIKEGDTQQHGLRPLLTDWKIYRAIPSRPWPGQQALHVSEVWLGHKDRSFDGPVRLGLDPVEAMPHISSGLTPRRSSDIRPFPLPKATPDFHSGFKLDSPGFILTNDEARAIVEADPHSSEVIRPIMNAREALLGLTDRQVIDFGVMAEEEAQQYRGAWEHVLANVKPDVEGKSRSYASWRDRWWQFWNPRAALRADLEGLDSALVIPGTSKHGVPVVRDAHVAYSHAVIVLPTQDMTWFGLLSSEPHWWWVVERSSKLKSDIRYSPSDCLVTFPPPTVTDEIEAAATRLYEARIALEGREGLTGALNAIHDPNISNGEVDDIREALKDLNRTVVQAYGWPAEWGTLDFYDLEDRGTRFTISGAAVHKVLDALTDSNIESYASSIGVEPKVALRQAMS